MTASFVPPSIPLHLAVIGVGQIGSALAFNLTHHGGHTVTVVARPGSLRLDQLRRDGAIVSAAGERAPVRVLDALDEQTPYDLVIVTLLAHQVDTVLPALRRSAAGCVQFMFNTFEPERLAQAIGPERCGLGMPFIRARLDRDGRLDAHVGGAGQKTMRDRRRWVDLFDAAGLPSVLELDMPSWLRSHAPLCVAFESVSVAGMRRGGAASWGEARVLAQGVKGGFALIESLGGTVYPQSKRRMRRWPTSTLAALLWGMSRVRAFRELLATGGPEAQALVDRMVEAASVRPDLVPTLAAMKPAL
ncbi:ketopantoate reductase family protein [Caulobacter sp. S45]|uniref:ketopantoate reductase family protein n=1 Tax=Caulobacter sp. S45 TaxID=1641861 RepID=UPI001C2D1A24|nr:2-dehydropantoate 2-reductase N-terminal domain-containing protein [Caulobacter sp. S45]